MAITHERLCDFIRKQGYVIAHVKGQEPALLRDDGPDMIALAVLYADEFEFDGQRYSRAAFEGLMGRLLPDTVRSPLLE